MKSFLSIIVLSTLFAGCANNSLVVTKCDKKVDDLCIKSHMVKFTKCNEPTKISNATYCK